MKVIDKSIAENYSKEVYSMAVDLFIRDHGAFLSGEQQLTEEEAKSRFHKARGGAAMLGFVALVELLKQAEETNSPQLMSKIKESFNLVVIELNKSKREG